MNRRRTQDGDETRHSQIEDDVCPVFRPEHFESNDSVMRNVSKQAQKAFRLPTKQGQSPNSSYQTGVRPSQMTPRAGVQMIANPAGPAHQTTGKRTISKPTPSEPVQPPRASASSSAHGSPSSPNVGRKHPRTEQSSRTQYQNREVNPHVPRDCTGPPAKRVATAGNRIGDVTGRNRAALPSSSTPPSYPVARTGNGTDGNLQLENALNAIGNKITNSMGGIEGAIGSLKASFTQNVDALRREREEMKDSLETAANQVGIKVAAVVEKMIDAVNAMRKEQSPSEDKTKSPEKQKAIYSMTEYMKYCTSLEFLDVSHGSLLYFPMKRDEEICQLLIDAASLVTEDGEDKAAFLESDVEIETRCRDGSIKRSTRPAMFFAIKGQQRAHDNIRAGAVSSFLAALPIDHALHPTSRSSKDEKKKVAQEMISTASLKFDPSYEAAWKSACRGAVQNAHSTAETSAYLILERYEGVKLPALPSVNDILNEGGNPVRINMFSLCLVVTKVFKHIQTLSGDCSEFSRSHGRFWAKEALFCNYILHTLQESENTENEAHGGAAERRTPIYLRAVGELSPLSEDDLKWVKFIRDTV